MKRDFVIEGPLYKVNVKIRSAATVNKAYKEKDPKEVLGFYDPATSTIWITETNEQETLHTLMHEIHHAIEYQVSYIKEEGTADIMAAFYIRFFGLKDMKDVLK